MRENLKISLASLLGIFILFSLFILGQFGRLEIGGWPAFYLLDLLLGGWAVGLTIFNLGKIKKWLTSCYEKKITWEKVFILWVGLGLIVALVFGDFNFKALFYLGRYLTYGWWFYLLDKLKVFPRHFLFYLTVALGWWVLAFGLIQYYLWPDMRFLAISGWDDHFYRLVGTSFDPNFMGLILGLFFSLLLQIKIVPGKFWQRLSLSAVQVLTLWGLALTFSRASFVAFALGIVLLSRKKISRLWPILVLGLMILFTPKPGGEGVVLLRTASIEARTTSSSQGLQQLQPYQWLVGQGLFNTSKPAQATTDYVRPDHAGLPDNLIVLLFQGTGVVGLLLAGLLTLKWRRRLLAANFPGAVALSMVLFHALFNNSLFQPFIFIYLGLILVSKVDN